MRGPQLRLFLQRLVATAAQLNELVGGGATALHSHAGGTPTRIAQEDGSAEVAVDGTVYLNGGDGGVVSVYDAVTIGPEHGANATIQTVLANGDPGGEVIVQGDTGRVFLLAAGGSKLDLAPGGLISLDNGAKGIVIDTTVRIVGLPGADPVVAGALWNDNGAVKISGG